MGRVIYKERKMVKLARFINGWFKIFPIAFFILIGVGNYTLLFFSLSILSSVIWDTDTQVGRENRYLHPWYGLFLVPV